MAAPDTVGLPALGANSHPIYSRDELQAEPRQSEIVTNVTQYTFDPVAGEGIRKQHSFAVILTQDCDLKQDYDLRHGGKPGELNGIILFEAEPWATVKVAVGGRDIWKPLGQNKNERYQLLEAVPPDCDLAGEGLPALVIDFKKVFTIDPAELERQLVTNADGARRRCRLLVPYREHLQLRAAFYLQRVGIPEPHQFPVQAEPPKALPAKTG